MYMYITIDCVYRHMYVCTYYIYICIYIYIYTCMYYCMYIKNRCFIGTEKRTKWAHESLMIGCWGLGFFALGHQSLHDLLMSLPMFGS